MHILSLLSSSVLFCILFFFIYSTGTGGQNCTKNTLRMTEFFCCVAHETIMSQFNCIIVRLCVCVSRLFDIYYWEGKGGATAVICVNYNVAAAFVVAVDQSRHTTWQLDRRHTYLNEQKWDIDQRSNLINSLFFLTVYLCQCSNWFEPHTDVAQNVGKKK